MTDSTELPKFYSTNQVAEMFSVTVGTVREWMRTGKLEGVKLGGERWRISENELRRFANETLEGK
jgi:excisionase family DNA binding protein